MAQLCHLCESEVSTNGAVGDEVEQGFECPDCNRPTCKGCRSFGVGREQDFCRRCRG